MHHLIQRANQFFGLFGNNRNGWRRNRTRFCSAIYVLLTALSTGATTTVDAAGPGEGCRPELVVGPVLEVAAAETTFYLRVSGSSDCLPPSGYMYISGLPPSVTLSDSEMIAAGSWVIPLSALENLIVRVPAGFVGSSDFIVTLFDGAGTTLSERVITLYAKSPILVALTKNEADPAQPKQAATTKPASPAAPVSAARPDRRSPTQAELAQAERMLDRGQQFLAQGNIVIAREYFARAAELGLPIAALKLAETHDPHELGRFKVHGLKPDPAEAKKWYERAIRLGVLEAEARLRRLGSR